MLAKSQESEDFDLELGLIPASFNIGFSFIFLLLNREKVFGLWRVDEKILFWSILKLDIYSIENEE